MVLCKSVQKLRWGLRWWDENEFIERAEDQRYFINKHIKLYYGGDFFGERNWWNYIKRLPCEPREHQNEPRSTHANSFGLSAPGIYVDGMTQVSSYTNIPRSALYEWDRQGLMINSDIVLGKKLWNVSSLDAWRWRR